MVFITHFCLVFVLMSMSYSYLDRDLSLMIYVNDWVLRQQSNPLDSIKCSEGDEVERCMNGEWPQGCIVYPHKNVLKDLKVIPLCNRINQPKM